MTIPLLLIRGDGVSSEAVASLRASPRARLFDAGELSSSPTAFSVRTARATIVATLRDPLEELVFTRTSGFMGALILAVDARYAEFRDASREAGVLDCLTLPITPSEADRILDVVEALPQPALEYPPLELYLDPIERTARHGAAIVRLTEREFSLLHRLVRSGSRPVPANEIHDYVWSNQREAHATREIVDVNVSQLRKKLRDIGLEGAIRTYRDFGYGLVDERSHE
jgi:DNA-binding winged helix-turn-helix (wHTH) protein